MRFSWKFCVQSQLGSAGVLLFISVQLNLRSAANWTSFPRSDVASKRIANMEILFLVGVRFALVLEEGRCGAVQFFK